MDSVLGPMVRSFVVDADRRVVESDGPEPRRGEPLAPGSGLADAALEALAALAIDGQAARRVGRDHLRGEHWIVEAAVVGVDPWRARVVAVEATDAVAADRDVFIGTLVHALRNISFGLLSAVEAIELDRPTGDQLNECLTHLRGPADRMSFLTERLAVLAAPPRLTLRRVAVEGIVEEALAKVAEGRGPTIVSMRAKGLTALADVAMLADAVAALLESGGKGARGRWRSGGPTPAA